MIDPSSKVIDTAPFFAPCHVVISVVPMIPGFWEQPASQNRTTRASNAFMGEIWVVRGPFVEEKVTIKFELDVNRLEVSSKKVTSKVYQWRIPMW